MRDPGRGPTTGLIRSQVYGAPAAGLPPAAASLQGSGCLWSVLFPDSTSSTAGPRFRPERHGLMAGECTGGGQA